MSRRPASTASRIDWTVPLDYARAPAGDVSPSRATSTRRFLSPAATRWIEAIDRILAALAAGRFIFNLGHGILPETPVAHVERLVERAWLESERAVHVDGGRGSRPRDRRLSLAAVGLYLAEGGARRRGHLVDGGDALPAAAVRLSRRRAAGLRQVRDVQGHGAAAAPRDHQPGDGGDLGARPVACLERRLARRAAGSRPSSRWWSSCPASTGCSRAGSRDFAEDRNTRGQRFYRIVNEVPTLLMIAIVILVVVKPF